VPGDLSGAVALVTGAASGIGAATTTALADAGVTVVVNDLPAAAPDGEKLAATVGGQWQPADVGDPDQAEALVEEVLAEHGRLNVLVSSAGITRTIPPGDLAAATPEIWHAIYAVNVVAPFVLATAAADALRAARGCIVNVGSHAGVRPGGSSIPYAASKAALHHQSRLLALALAPQVRVNVVAPGPTETGWSANWEPIRDQLVASAPTGRLSLPADVADAVLFLVRNDQITGAVVPVDGGLALR
jgi:NAD(P)-dependent dehydrogenase (short-subunit alcohol dehydrogenase family)